MGTLRAIAVFGAFVAVVAAQAQPLPGAQITARLFQGQVLARYDDPERLEGSSSPMERMANVLRVTFTDEQKGQGFQLQVANSARGQVCVGRGTAEQLAAVQRVFDELQKAEPPRARLQCSLVTMPWSVAEVHHRRHGLVAVVQEDVVGALVRDAVKNKGTLRNLPEVLAAPLAPFVADASGKPPKVKAAPVWLRGEMVPLGEREVAIAMHLVRGPLPADKACTPTGALLQPVFRLPEGKAGVAMVCEGDMATALVVRCVEILAETPRAPAGR